MMGGMADPRDLPDWLVDVEPLSEEEAEDVSRRFAEREAEMEEYGYRLSVDQMRRDLCARSAHMPAYHQGEWRCFRCNEPVESPV